MNAIRTRLNLPANAQLLMAAGDYVPGDGMQLAVWAFDVLKYVAPELHMILVGDGAGRERVQRFSLALGADDYRVYFLQDDNPLSAVAEADVVWGTHPRGGAMFLKAAIECSIPVVAMQSPETEGLAGAILTPAGDPVALATATRKVLAELVPR